MDLLINKFAPLLELPYDPDFKYFFIAVNILALVGWIFTILTHNLSFIDRIWPIEPCLFAWAYLYSSYKLGLAENGTSQVRLIVICLLVSLWAIRLFYNYWRKGGYEWKAEDYRWLHVRKMFGYPEKKLTFHIFNFVFISFFQTYFLMGLVTPMWFIQKDTVGSKEPFNKLDLILAISFLIFFAIETIADRQQWNFQKNKYKWLDAQKENKKLKFTDDQIEEFKRGFLVKGLFKYSRHPNFFAELCLWWVIYGFTISAQYSKLVDNFDLTILINYTILPIISLMLIFNSSTNLTEKISLSKYPKYAEYQSKVSRIIPFMILPSKKRSKQN